MMSTLSLSTLLVLLLVCWTEINAHVLKSVAAPYDSRRDLQQRSDGGIAVPSQASLDVNRDADPAAGIYKIIGGIAMTKPCCVSWGPKRIDCFIRSQTSTVHHWSKENGSYAEWNDLGGPILNDIECISRKQGHIDILAAGIDNTLMIRSYDGNWSDWISKGGRIMEAPSCASRSSSVVDCMLRGGTNIPFAISAVDGHWGNYSNRGGSLQYPPGASRRSDNIVDFWGCGGDNYLYHTYLNRTWHHWENEGGPVRGRPSVVSTENNTEVFVLGMANQLMHLSWNGDQQSWENLGGVLQDVPSCVGIGRDVHCFGIGPRSYLYRISYIDGNWSDWMNAYGAFIDAPSCVVSNAAEKEVSCYMRGFTRDIVELIYKF